MSQITSGFRAVLNNPHVYNCWVNLLGAKRAKVDFVENYLKADDGCRVLDVGCGTGSQLEFFSDTVRYTGIDISEEYVEHAKEKYGERGTFFAIDPGDVPEFDGAEFDLAIGAGLLHHLDDEEVIALLKWVYDSLAPGGRFVTSDGVYVDGQSPIARFIISRDRGQNVRALDEYLDLANSVFDDVEYDVRHDRLRLPYTHLLMTCIKKQEA
jgi:cyclopropane fatty-acyl-phospholipid synthase-like methyltransferase